MLVTLLPAPHRRSQPIVVSRREIVNAIPYLRRGLPAPQAQNKALDFHLVQKRRVLAIGLVTDGPARG